MISSLCWLPKGAAKPVPLPAPVTEEELASMREHAAGMAAGVLDVRQRNPCCYCCAAAVASSSQDPDPVVTARMATWFLLFRMMKMKMLRPAAARTAVTAGRLTMTWMQRQQ